MQRPVLGSLVAILLASCGNQPAADLTIERLPDSAPALPSVPTLPPPPHPVQYPDQSYSVYGLRRREAVTMNTDVQVTGYIVEIYQAPECPEGRTCPQPAAPHMWIADTRGEADATHRLAIVGYAENQTAIDEALELARRGRPWQDPDEAAAGVPAVPVDFFVGNKVVVRGRFARISGSGFNLSEGLIEYAGHTTSEITPEAREALGRAAGPEPGAAPATP